MTRVAIGPAEVAGTSSALAAGLEAHGAHATLAFWSPLPGPFASDRALPRSRRVAFGLAAPLRFDVLHFQYGTTWVPGHLDARLGRRLRRLLVVTYQGDDCRTFETASRLGWPLAPFKDPGRDGDVRRRVARLGRLCAAAVVMDLEVASYVVPHFPRTYVVPIPLHEHHSPPPRRREDGRLLVVHAPSDERIKGTAAVRAAAAEAARRIPLDLDVLHGLPHARVAARLAEADVVVDQMHSSSASILALEAMRAGLPVLTHIDRRSLAPFHADLPVVPVTADTLAAELERLGREAELRRNLGELGRDYVERVHAARPAARAILNVYEHARSAPSGVYWADAEGVHMLGDSVLDG